jgi:hypothetical protein
MKDILYKFLHEVADGKFGESRLNNSRINAFFNKADEQDLNELEEFFWSWTSELGNDDDIDIEELEQHIYEVIGLTV